MQISGYSSAAMLAYRSSGMKQKAGTVKMQDFSQMVQNTSAQATSQTDKTAATKEVSEVDEMAAFKQEIYEKLAEIVNLIENLLKKDDKYLKLNYSEICEEFLNDDIIKKYKKILQCFRHSAEHSIEERSTFTDDKKDFFIDFGIVIVKTIHKLLEINHQKE